MRHNLLLNRSRGTASLQPLVLLAIIVVMTGAQAVLVPGSLTVEQMLIISRQASALGIITLGQAAVILVGGIDLSVGATVMMVNIFCISAMQGSDANGPLGLLVCLFIGLAIGTANAFGVLFLKIAPFVMTLCTTTICEGICYVYTQGSPTGSAAPFIRALGTGRLFGIPFSTLIWLALAAAMWVVLRFTALGRRLYAVGGSPKAARLSGIANVRVVAGAYIFCALMSAVAGLILTGYHNIASLTLAGDYSMNSLAAALIGGNAIEGGRGGVWGVVLGSFFMMLLMAILTMLGISQVGKLIIQGCIILGSGGCPATVEKGLKGAGKCASESINSVFQPPCDVSEALHRAKGLGYDCMEICLTADRKPGPAVGSVTDALDISGYFNRLLHEHAGEAEFLQLRRMAEEVGIPLCSVGGIISFSIYPLTAREPEVVQTSMDAVRRMLDAAQVLGAASALVIPGVATEDMAYEEAYTTAQERVSELADYAPSVGLMIENVWNNMLYSPLELARFVDEMGRKNVGICFDIANARRFGYPEQWIRTLGGRILEFHCKDYRMSVDNINGFTNLLDGDVNYPAVMAAIRDIGFDGDLIVELIPPAHHLVERTLRHALETLRELCQMNGRKG